MSDEAHRSQYGDEHWDAQSQRMKKGFSQKMREALPGASFIGFTGTPISDRDRDTEEVFGHYIDIYDMSQAVDDGATRPVYYESRVVNLRLDDDTMKLLNDEFDHLGDEGATEEQIRKAKQEHSRLEVLLGEDATIDTLTRDIVHHYEDNRAQELTGKAMIVALTRPIAIKIYRKILELPRVDGESEGGDERFEPGPRRLATDHWQRSLQEGAGPQVQGRRRPDEDSHRQRHVVDGLRRALAGHDVRL